jgi:hypothetical protein
VNKSSISDGLQASGKCYLLDELPPEVRNHIWKLCVTVDNPIFPIQLCHKSNKFICSSSQIVQDENGISKKTISAVKPLTALQLAQVCHRIYDEVSNTHLFYSVNEFNFRNAQASNLITYLLAITEPRRNAIRSIACEWQRYHRDSAQMFTVLAACKSLQILDLKIDQGISDYHVIPALDCFKFPGLAESKVAVRGLKKLTLEPLPRYPWYGSQNEEEKVKKLCNFLKSLLVKEMAKPRGKFLLQIFTNHACSKHTVYCMPYSFRYTLFLLSCTFMARC